MPRTGRQIVMERLNKAIQTATTGDLQRAAMFLEGAREVRAVAPTNAPKLVVLKALLGRKKLTTRLRGNVVVVM